MVRTLRNVGGGLIASLLLLASAFSNGALIFTGPLQPFLGQGVATALLITTAVTTIFVALTSNFPSAIAGPLGSTAALLAAVMVTLAPVLSAMPPAQALALAIAGLGGAALLTGLALFALGWRRLGKFIRFVPYPVVAGFFAAIGWLIVSGAIRMATGVPISRATLLSFAAPHTELLAGLTVLWAAALWLLTARFKGPLTLPLALVAATLFVHGIFAGFHLPEQVVQHSGLMFSVPANSHPVIPLITGEYFRADWRALWPVAGDMGAVAVMAILGVLLNSTVLELATEVDADIDRELKMQGLANVASALAGGFVGTVHVPGTLINRAAGGTGRLSGVVAGLVALAVLMGGGQVVGYVPRFVLGGLLVQLGARIHLGLGRPQPPEPPVARLARRRRHRPDRGRARPAVAGGRWSVGSRRRSGRTSSQKRFALTFRQLAGTPIPIFAGRVDPTDSLIFVETGPVTVILERPGQPPLRVRVFGAHTLVGEIGFFLERTTFGKPARRARCRCVGTRPRGLRGFEEDAAGRPLGTLHLHHQIAIRTPDLCQSPDNLAPALISEQSQGCLRGHKRDDPIFR